MNAFLQALYATAPFKSALFEHCSPGSPGFPHDPERLITGLSHLFSRLQKSADEGFSEPIDPSDLKSLMPEPFGSSKDQEDTMVFGRALLDDIEKRSRESPISDLIEKLFTSEISHRFDCQDCGNAPEAIEKAVEVPLSFSKFPGLLYRKLRLGG